MNENVKKSQGKKSLSRIINLVSKVWGSGVQSIGDYAFYCCEYLYEFDTGSDLSTINKNAFYGCESLKYNTYNNALYLGNKDNPYYLLVSAVNSDILYCTIHKDTKCIAGDAFSDCTNLMSLSYDNTKTNWAKVVKNDNWFDCGNHSSSEVNCSNGQVKIDD